MIQFANDPALLAAPSGALFGRARRMGRPPEDPESLGVQLRQAQAAADLRNGEGPPPMLTPNAALRLGDMAQGMPGPIGGFGGGTFNMDGTMATPVQRDAAPAPALPAPTSGGLLGSRAPATLDATQGAPGHWSVEGFDQQLANRPPATLGEAAQGPLGGSMRQPFDYDAALKALAGDQRKPKWWQYGLAILADTLAAQSGRPMVASQALASQNMNRQNRMQDALATLAKWKHDSWQDQNQADLRAANPFTIGRDRVQIDPATGEARVLYDGPEDFQIYAEDLGLKPGTPEYFKAAEDFVLKGSGPSAHARDLQLDDHRTSNDKSLEAFRQQGRATLETLRQGNRRGMVDYRNANPPPARPRAARENIVAVRSREEAAKLPSGTKFRTPDGQVLVRR